MSDKVQLFEDQPIRTAWDEEKAVARRGGGIAGNARAELEMELGHSVITSKNASELNLAVIGMIESAVEVREKGKNVKLEE